MKKKVLAMAMSAVLLISSFAAAGCGSSGYSSYYDAFEAMLAGGGLDADISMTLIADESTTIEAGGSIIMDADAMYFEATVGESDESGEFVITQYLEGDTLYSDVNGVRSTYNTSTGSDETVLDSTGEEEERGEGGYTTETFLIEFASFLEAGKIKEMGLLDPISESTIKKITTSSDSDGTTYTMTFPDSAVEKIFNTMIEDQTGDDSIEFSDLEDFTCVAHANTDDVLDSLTYSGTTNVTVSASVTGGSEETFALDITITFEFNNPGSSVEVPTVDTSEWS